MQLTFSWAEYSDRGPRRENEDLTAVWQIGDDWLVAAIADGLGGHVGGRMAASIAIEMLGRAIHDQQRLELKEVALAIHRTILSEQDVSPDAPRMATTLSAALMVGQEAHVLHCGDTRVALARGDGIIRLTQDHTEAARFLKEGLITKEEFRLYPRKNILESALGIRGEPRIDTRVVKLEKGDRVLLMSDGVYNVLALREIRSMAATSATAGELVQVVRTEVANRGPSDNNSFIAVYVN